METKPAQLRVLIMQREDWWVAQCLEFDLAAQAHGSFDNIKAEFCRMLGVRLAACRVEEIDPFKLPPASEIYNDISKRARPQIIFSEESDMALRVHATDFEIDTGCCLQKWLIPLFQLPTLGDFLPMASDQIRGPDKDGSRNIRSLSVTRH
jgi:hypothetical protein